MSKNSKINFIGLFDEYKMIFFDRTVTVVVVIIVLSLGCYGTKSDYIRENYPLAGAISAFLLAFGVGGFGITFIRPLWGFVIAPVLIALLSFINYCINKFKSGLIKSSDNIQNGKNDY